jgi:hypothetical protein
MSILGTAGSPTFMGAGGGGEDAVGAWATPTPRPAVSRVRAASGNVRVIIPSVVWAAGSLARQSDDRQGRPAQSRPDAGVLELDEGAEDELVSSFADELDDVSWWVKKNVL